MLLNRSLINVQIEVVPASHPNEMGVLPPNNEWVLIVPMGDHRPNGDPSRAWLGRCVNGVWMLRLEEPGWLGRLDVLTAAGWYPMSAASLTPELHVRHA